MRRARYAFRTHRSPFSSVKEAAIRSVPRALFSLPKVTVAVRREAGGNNANIHANSGVVWGIPAKNPVALVASDSPYGN